MIKGSSQTNNVILLQKKDDLPNKEKMEEFITKHGFSKAEQLTSDAQMMMHDAWGAPTRKEARALVKKALKKSPLCADAYNFMAEDIKNIDERLVCYQRAVEAGLLALGPNADDDRGHYWGLLETRPYMRALAELANTYWVKGDHQASIESYQLMLELNPMDNQGVRYILMAHLLEFGDDKALKKVLTNHGDESSSFCLYTKALLAFKEQSPKADAQAKAAFKANAYIPNMLAGIIPLAPSDNGYIRMGGEDEASDYVIENKIAWLATQGAIEWLVKTTTK